MKKCRKWPLTFLPVGPSGESKWTPRSREGRALASQWAFAAVNTVEPAMAELFSIDHFAAVTRQHKVDVELLNHPIMDGLFTKLAMLRTRKPGGPHPLVVGEASYQRFLTAMAACTKVQLARKN